VARRRHLSVNAGESKIRRATPEDAAAIARIQVRGSEWAYRELLPSWPLPTEERIAQRTHAWLSQLAPESERHSFVAESRDEPIGFVTCGPTEDATRMSSGEIFAIYLEPHVVGSGVGCALFAHAVASLAARGFADAVLWVLEDNARARRFYERAGWTADGARKAYERGGPLCHEIRYHTRLRQ
jgi:ribosomal protein S18 acetylase RimI-like enzyme